MNMGSNLDIPWAQGAMQGWISGAASHGSAALVKYLYEATLGAET